MAGLAWRDWVRLTRLKLTVFIALSALTGHVLAAGGWSVAALFTALGCTLLSAGGSTLNQLQEVLIDGRMRRTCERPLPAGRLRRGPAFLIGLVLLHAGLAVLAAAGGRTAMLLGGAAMGWYHLVYTPLKRRTAFAAVPGALIGALGPAIGWSAAGGSLAAGELWALMLLFFLWQVPHFWLLNARHAADYAAAGLPSARAALGSRGLGRVAFVWAAATAVAGLMLPLHGLVRHEALIAALAIGAIGLVLVCRELPGAHGADERVLRRGFAGVNLYALAVMVLLIADRILRP